MIEFFIRNKFQFGKDYICDNEKNRLTLLIHDIDMLEVFNFLQINKKKKNFYKISEIIMLMDMTIWYWYCSTKYMINIDTFRTLVMKSKSKIGYFIK